MRKGEFGLNTARLCSLEGTDNHSSCIVPARIAVSATFAEDWSPRLQVRGLDIG